MTLEHRAEDAILQYVSYRQGLVFLIRWRVRVRLVFFLRETDADLFEVETGVTTGDVDVMQGAVRVEVVRQVFIAVLHRCLAAQEDWIRLDASLLRVLTLDDTDDEHLTFFESHDLGRRHEPTAVHVLRLRFLERERLTGPGFRDDGRLTELLRDQFGGRFVCGQQIVRVPAVAVDRLPVLSVQVLELGIGLDDEIEAHVPAETDRDDVGHALDRRHVPELIEKEDDLTLAFALFRLRGDTRERGVHLFDVERRDDVECRVIVWDDEEHRHGTELMHHLTDLYRPVDGVAEPFTIFVMRFQLDRRSA